MRLIKIINIARKNISSKIESILIEIIQNETQKEWKMIGGDGVSGSCQDT